MVVLGVGKNMVRSMRHWCVTTGMLEADPASARGARMRPTELGSFLFGSNGHDPFLEDPGTVWLLHWNLASNPRLATWHYVFNQVRESEFERRQLAQDIIRSAGRGSAREVSPGTIERDVDCLLRTYVPSEPDKRLTREELLDCPLTDLGLIRRSSGHGFFTLLRGSHDSLPLQVFAYCLGVYWTSLTKNADTLSFEQVAHGVGSPGQVFKLTENAVIDRLYQLDQVTNGSLRYDATAGLRQVYRTKRLDPVKQLRDYYAAPARRSRHGR